MTGSTAMAIEDDKSGLLSERLLAEGMAITILPPGRRAGVVLRPIPESGIPTITATALAPPVRRRAIPPAKDDRRSAQERAEAAERDEAMSVALRQPHRAGQGGDRRSTPFGRFCEDFKPRPLGEHCYRAGERYAEIVKEEKNAQGFIVVGGAPREPGYQTLTEEQLQARKDLAISRLKEANAVLVAIRDILPRRMERLTYDQLEPSIYDHAILAHGLDMLAVAFGFRVQSIREIGR